MARRLEFEAAQLAADKLGDLIARRGDLRDPARCAIRRTARLGSPSLAVYRRLGDSRKLADLLAAVVDVRGGHGRAGPAAPRARPDDGRGARARRRARRPAAARDRRRGSEPARSRVDARGDARARRRRRGARRRCCRARSTRRRIAETRRRSRRLRCASAGCSSSATARRREPSTTRASTGSLRTRTCSTRCSSCSTRDDDASERADVTERRLAVERGPEAEAMALALWQTRVDLGDEAAGERALELGYRAYPASAVLRGRLEERYRARGEWAKLAELCLLDASAREDQEERLARLLEAANLWRSEVGDAAIGGERAARSRATWPRTTRRCSTSTSTRWSRRGTLPARPRRSGWRSSSPRRTRAGGRPSLGARASIRATIGESDGRARGPRGRLRARARALRRRARRAARERVRSRRGERRCGRRPRPPIASGARAPGRRGIRARTDPPRGDREAGPEGPRSARGAGEPRSLARALGRGERHAAAARGDRRG